MKRLLAFAAALLASAPALAAPNPFLPHAPGSLTIETARDGNSPERSLIRIKGDVARSEIVEGQWADGSYTLYLPSGEYTVVTDRQKIVRHKGGAAEFAAFYARLSPAERTTVDANLAKIGPHLLLWDDNAVISPAPAREVAGKQVSCFHFASRLDAEDIAERCFLYRTEVYEDARNLMDDGRTLTQATSIKEGETLDDALFALPAYPVDENDSVNEVMIEKYARMFERLKKPDFSLDDLDLYAH